MPISELNSLNSGILPSGASADPLEAILPVKSGILRGVQLLGAFVGLADALMDSGLKRVTAWKADSVFTGAAAGTPLAVIAATSTNPIVLRITSSTDASDILGNTQLQSTDGSGATALGRFFPRLNNIISCLGRISWSNNGGATLIGLANVATGLMNAAGTSNVTDGIFIYRGAGSGTVTGYVRRGGATKQSVVLTTTAVAATFYTFGFRFNTTGVVFYMDGQEFGIEMASDGSDAPNAALALTVIQGGNARTLDVQRVFASQEAI